MELREIVETYLKLAGQYGKSVPLASFARAREETERDFSVFDEDYHISRFIHFQNGSGERYKINGFPQTHVSIDAGIQSLF